MRNDDGDLRFMASTEKISIPNKTFLQFGEGYDREGSAGQIAYGRHDGGQEGTLNIVGAGKNGQVRRVRVWDALQIGGWTIQEEGDQLVFKRGSAGDGDNQPHLRMAADGNFWVSRSTARGWVADNIGALRNEKVSYDANINVCHHGGRGCIQAANAWDARTSDNPRGDWEMFKIGRR
jgi:hypothetical protein